MLAILEIKPATLKVNKNLYKKFKSILKVRRLIFFY